MFSIKTSEGAGWFLEQALAADDTDRAAVRRLTLIAGIVACVPFIGLSMAFAVLPPGGSFIDDDGISHEGNIEAIYADGVTQGCDALSPRYCPYDRVSRGQMATFLTRALDLPPGPDAFSDDEGSGHEAAIDAIAAAGITDGCGPDAYCPSDPITRAQMASFLRRAFELPPGANAFTDDEGNRHEPSIDAVAAAGITLGCGPGLFCPADHVTRAQMASFLARALGLTPLFPPPRPDVVFRQVAQGLTAPTFATAPAGDARLFITELAGRVMILVDGSVTSTPYLDISGLVLEGGERGLLGMAFHPDYGSNGLFYLHYTNTSGNTEIAEFQASADPDLADPSSRRVLLTVPQPFSNHNGGMIEFGPDGYLYVALGDGGGGGCPSPCPARDPSRLLGSILRIDVDGGIPYGIPADNPYATGGGAPEVLHKGLRNPWRTAIDPDEGVLFIADVGQSSWEEISVVSTASSGLDLGWDVLEGIHCYPPGSACSNAGTVLPAVEYASSGGNCTVIGGLVYRGAALPHLTGHYFYSDLCGGWVRSFDYRNGTVFDHRDWPELTFSGNAWSFGRDGFGELYVLTGAGRVYRLEADS